MYFSAFSAKNTKTTKDMISPTISAYLLKEFGSLTITINIFVQTEIPPKKASTKYDMQTAFFKICKLFILFC